MYDASGPATNATNAATSSTECGRSAAWGIECHVSEIRTIIADAGHESRKLARTLKQHQGWQLRIVAWIVERSLAWLGRNRRLSEDYEYRVQTSETMIDLAAIRLMLNRIAPV